MRLRTCTSAYTARWIGCVNTGRFHYSPITIPISAQAPAGPVPKGTRRKINAIAPRGLSVPAQFSCLFCCEVQKIKEAVVALDVAEDVSNIRAVRKKRIHGVNQLGFIIEEALVSFRLSSRARCPGLDSNNVVSRFVACIRSASEMD